MDTAMDRIAVPCVNHYDGTYGIDALLKALNPAWILSEPVCLDLNRCSFLSAEGAAILAILQLQRESYGWATDIDWTTVNDKVVKQLGRWNIASLYRNPIYGPMKSAIPLLQQAELEPLAV